MLQTGLFCRIIQYESWSKKTEDTNRRVHNLLSFVFMAFVGLDLAGAVVVHSAHFAIFSLASSLGAR